MNVSQDFKESMAKLHRSVQSLERDNKEMRRELEAVKKELAATQSGAIDRHKSSAMRAIASNDQSKMDILAATSVDPTEEELLRQNAYVDMTPAPFPQINADLYNKMLEAANPVTPVTITVETETPQSKRNAGLVAQLKQNSVQMAQQREREKDIAVMQQRLAKKQMEDDMSRRIGSRGAIWKGPFDA